MSVSLNQKITVTQKLIKKIEQTLDMRSFAGERGWRKVIKIVHCDSMLNIDSKYWPWKKYIYSFLFSEIIIDLFIRRSIDLWNFDICIYAPKGRQCSSCIGPATFWSTLTRTSSSAVAAKLHWKPHTTIATLKTF